jgi:hypothetical protein
MSSEAYLPSPTLFAGLGVAFILLALPAVIGLARDTPDLVFYGQFLESHKDLISVFTIFFWVLLLVGLGSLFYGLRQLTRPPSFLYRLTHPEMLAARFRGGPPRR